MVSGFKLALQSEIGSRLPEQMSSTATADAETIRSENEMYGQGRTYLA
jgi:hypothetical protein